MRAMRFAPETPPRTSMRTSPAAASSITEPMKKLIRPERRPANFARCARLNAIHSREDAERQGNQEQDPINTARFPSLRRAVNQAVPIQIDG